MSIRIRYLKHIRKRENVYNDDLNNLTGDSVMMNYQRFECLMKYSGFVKQPHMTYMDFAKLVEEDTLEVQENIDKYNSEDFDLEIKKISSTNKEFYRVIVLTRKLNSERE